MITYKVHFSIDGEVEVKADSPEEAHHFVSQFSKDELAEIGELEVFAPVEKTAHETETVQ